MTARSIVWSRWRAHHRAAVLVALASVLWLLDACGGLSNDVVCAQESTSQVRLRVLLVGEDEEAVSYRAWRSLLEWEGVPHDAHVGAAAPLTAATLRDDTGAGAYQAIVLAAGTIGQEVLSPTERMALEQYADDTGARIVHAFGAAPGAGLGPPAKLADVRLEVTEEGRAWFPEIVGPVVAGAAFGVLPAAAPGATTLVAGPGGASVVSMRQVAGHDELYMTVAMASNEPAFGFLSHGLLGWATRGVHLGLRHHFFGVQIDDVLLPNFRWDVEANKTSIDGDHVIRMTPDDVERAATWSDRQDFRLDLAVNGVGSTVENVHSHRLCQTLRSHVDDFGWINHTFSHRDFDDLSAEEITTEVARNIEWAEVNGFPIDERELVTGENKGLGNPEIVDPLEDLGIAYIASDASRDPLPERLGRAWTVPRHPANIYYDTGTIEETLDQYDHRYRETCEGAFCLTSRPTFEEYLALESANILKVINGNDPRTFYMHQANLAEEGTLYPVLDAVLDRFRAVSRQPLLQPTLAESGDAQLERLAWQETLADDAVTAYVEGGSVVIRSERDIRVPVTGAGDARYGVERSGWVRVRAGEELRLPLTTAAH